jgi:ribosomal protein S18 acetylase RimI-like enzyme
MSVWFRPYVASDFEAFVQAQVHAFATQASGAYTKEELEIVASARRGKEREAEMLLIDEWVAVSPNDELVGAAGWSWQLDGEVLSARIRRVWVHPDFAGQGLGRELVTLAEARARSAGAERYVVCASMNAIGFYEKLGFRAIRPDPRIYDGREVPFLFMGK